MEMVVVVKGMVWRVGMNTGLGSQERPVRTLAPRSCYGVDMLNLGGFLGGGGSADTYIYRADEILVAHEDIGHGKTEDYSEDPGADKAFDGLFGGELDELCAAKCDAADVCKDVVGDDERGWQEEPNHAFEDVVHYEMCLDDNQVERHVCPGELGELEAVVSLLKRADEEYEA